MYWQSEKEWRDIVKRAPDFEPDEAFVETARKAGLSIIRRKEKKRIEMTVLYQGAVIAASLLLVWGVASQQGTANKRHTENAKIAKVEQSSPQKNKEPIKSATAVLNPHPSLPVEQQVGQPRKAAAEQTPALETKKQAADSLPPSTEAATSPGDQKNPWESQCTRCSKSRTKRLYSPISQRIG